MWVFCSLSMPRSHLHSLVIAFAARPALLVIVVTVAEEAEEVGHKAGCAVEPKQLLRSVCRCGGDAKH